MTCIRRQASNLHGPAASVSLEKITLLYAQIIALMSAQNCHASCTAIRFSFAGMLRPIQNCIWSVSKSEPQSSHLSSKLDSHIHSPWTGWEWSRWSVQLLSLLRRVRQRCKACLCIGWLQFTLKHTSCFKSMISSPLILNGQMCGRIL